MSDTTNELKGTSAEPIQNDQTKRTLDVHGAHSLHPVVRSIASAPLNGTEILVWRKDAGWLLARWIAPCDFLPERELERMELKDTEEPDWFYADFISGGWLDGGAPTHWMPLPDAPNHY